ncbi:hypothetical protein AVEN_22253-1 [Araneus ventricosus]|uniref:Uncharacterized protein n=1 Tax=Araneus ventricosus TaxID=182803 RepID=A0A4Y2U270_ARAVE|nr:hypothetical protein AVEN_22253-1 [Araneus ventricosus]
MKSSRPSIERCFLSVFVLLAVIGSSITAFEYYAKVKFSKNYDGGSKDGKSVDFDEVENVSTGKTDDVSLLGMKEKTFDKYLKQTSLKHTEPDC